MATRGHLGGLAAATTDMALLLDAAGKDVVLIETVGVGQDEVEIAKLADVTVVVLVPGMGDDVQAIKAGHHGDRRCFRRQQSRSAGRGSSGARNLGCAEPIDEAGRLGASDRPDGGH